jgi:hypothetical protein
MGIPTGKIFRRGDGDGELKPDGEFPVAIPSRGILLNFLRSWRLEVTEGASEPEVDVDEVSVS